MAMVAAPFDLPASLDPSMPGAGGAPTDPFAAAELKRTSPSPRVVSSESDDDVPEVSHPSQPKVAVPRGDVVETTGDDLRGVLEAEAGGFATFDDDPSGLLGLRR